ncbi:MAG: hypothetical protein QM784_35020 [Polyangiaceae bacterium]
MQRTRCSNGRTLAVPIAGLLTALGVIVPTSDAIAQHCQMHGPSSVGSKAKSSRQATTPQVYATASWETAKYRNSRYEGHFEGLLPELGLVHDSFMVAARLPMYRLLRNGLPVKGMGDATFLGQQVLYRPTPKVQLGWRAALSIPTGDSEQDLGMGHTMVMPGAFARGHWSDLTVHLGLEYSRALTSGHGGHHSHRVYFPIVQPMNSQELGGAALAELPLLENVRVRTRFQTARPIGEPHGAARSILGFGMALERDGFSSFLEWQTAIEGSPFTSRYTCGVTFVF